MMIFNLFSHSLVKGKSVLGYRVLIFLESCPKYFNPRKHDSKNAFTISKTNEGNISAVAKRCAYSNSRKRRGS